MMPRVFALSTGHADNATMLRPLADQFYGDRTGTLVDPLGHVWTLATHREDVPVDESSRRVDAMMKSGT